MSTRHKPVLPMQHRPYFWNTRLAAAALARGPLPPAAQRNLWGVYSLACLALVYLFEMLPAAPAAYPWSLAVGGIADAAVVLWGIHLTYVANGGAEGERFLEKTMALALPLGIRLGVATPLLFLVVGLWAEPDSAGEAWSAAVLRLALQVVYVLRLAEHFRAIAAMEANAHAEPAPAAED